MSLNVPLLRESFALVAERQPRLTRRFYQILFERHPELAALFSPGASARQEQMLTEALLALMDHLEDAGWLTTALPTLGAKHVGYGVTDAMYDCVGECLLATIAEAAGPDWSPALEAAWSDAYGAVAALMLRGAHEARDASKRVGGSVASMPRPRRQTDSQPPTLRE